MDALLASLDSQTCALHFTLLGYIDPSTGSLVFQALAASLISAGLFFKSLRHAAIWLLTGGWLRGPGNGEPVSAQPVNLGAASATSVPHNKATA